MNPLEGVQTGVSFQQVDGCSFLTPCLVRGFPGLATGVHVAKPQVTTKQ